MGYKLIAELGRGGMGTVFRARHVELNRDVAIKFVGGALETTPAIVERFLREMSVLQGLSHPGIVRCLDAGVAKGRPYMVMELLEGHDLLGILKQHGQLPLAAALDIMIQLLDALAFVHERGLVHRDIKPANVMVDVRGRAVLTDFGLVRQLDRTRVTQAGHAVGTLLYIAPEIIEGQGAEAPADLWAAGALFYEMLAGRPAFDASSVGEAVSRILDSEPPALELLRTDIPMTVPPLIARFLEKDPQRRWPSAAVARAALLELSDELEVGELDVTRATLAGQAMELQKSTPSLPLKEMTEVVPARPRHTRRHSALSVERALRVARVIVVVLAVAVAGLAIVVFRPPPKPPEQVVARWTAPATLEVTARTDRPQRARLMSGASLLAEEPGETREHRLELTSPPGDLVIIAGGRAHVTVPPPPLAQVDVLSRAVRAARYDARRLDEVWRSLRKRELDPHSSESDRGRVREVLIGDPELARRLEGEVRALAEPVEAAWRELKPLVGVLLVDPATPPDARRDLLETLERLDAVDAIGCYLGVAVPFDVQAAMRPAVELSESAGGRTDERLRRAHPPVGELGPLVFLPEDMLDKSTLHTYLGDIMIGAKSRFKGKPRVSSFTFDASVATFYLSVRSLFPNMRLKITNAAGLAIPVRYPNASALYGSDLNCLIVKLTGPLSHGSRWTVSLSRAFQTSDQFFVDFDHVAVER